MEIEYLDRGALEAATPPGARPLGWSDVEVTRLRLVVQCIRAGRTPSDVLSLRSLRLRSDPDNPGWIRTELSSDRGLTISFKLDSSPITAMLDIAPTRTDSGR
jgi:hypothetical protein